METARVDEAADALRTGADFRRALSDGRSVWVDGEAVDVASHPLFAPALGVVERLLARHASQESRELLTATGPDGVTRGRWAVPPRNAQDLRRAGQVSTLFAEETHGLMGRLWDTSGGCLAGLLNVAKDAEALRPGTQAVIERAWEDISRGLLLCNVAFVDPPHGRGLPAHQKNTLRVVERRADGVVVRGAKALCTGAAYSDELLVLRVGYELPNLDDAAAVGFFVKPATPGLRILCRPGLGGAHRAGDPLAVDEVDTWLVFEDVFIPHARLLYAGEKDVAALVWKAMMTWDKHGFVRRLLTRMELLFGLSFLMSKTLGVGHYPSAQKVFRDAGRHAALVARLVAFAEASPQPAVGSGGAVRPEPLSLQLALQYALEHLPEVARAVELLGGQGLVLNPSQADLGSEEVGHHYAEYFGGDTGDPSHRAALMSVAAELLGSRSAQRQRLLDYYGTGGDQVLTLQLSEMLDAGRGVRLVRRLLEQREGDGTRELSS